MIKGSGMTLTHNEVKDIIKVINSLQNREILLRGATKNITTQKRGLLNFLVPLKEISFP